MPVCLPTGRHVHLTARLFTNLIKPDAISHCMADGFFISYDDWEDAELKKLRRRLFLDNPIGDE